MMMPANRVRAATPEEMTWEDFLPAVQGDIDAMYRELTGFADQVVSPHLKALLDAFFSDSEITGPFRRAPAAKGFHHTSIGGLLEHTLSVTRLLAMVADHYPKSNRDLLIAGAFSTILEKSGSLRIRGTSITAMKAASSGIS